MDLASKITCCVVLSLCDAPYYRTARRDIQSGVDTNNSNPVINIPLTLQWRHNGRDGVSNHQPHDCLLNRLFRHRSNKNIKAPRHWPLWGIHQRPVNSQHKWLVTRNFFPLDDVIMNHTRCFMWDVITHRYHRFICGYVKSPARIGNRWIITFHRFMMT